MNVIYGSFDPELVQRLGWTLLHFVWQGAIAGGAAWLVLRSTHRQSASLRYNLLLIHLLILVACPLITLTLIPVAATEIRNTSELPAVAVIATPEGRTGIASLQDSPGADDRSGTPALLDDEPVRSDQGEPESLLVRDSHEPQPAGHRLSLSPDVGAADEADHEHVTYGRLSADGSTLVTSGHKQMRVYDVKSGEQRTVIKGAGDGHGGFAVSPDGSTVASCWNLFDARTGEERQRFGVNGGQAGDVSFSSDGRYVGISTRSSGFGGVGNRLWVVDLKARETFELAGPSEDATAVAVSPHGQRLAVACVDNSVLVYDVAAFARVGLFAPTRARSVVRKYLKSKQTLKKITGQLVDSNGRPVSGVRILLRERPLGAEVSESRAGLDRTSDIADTWTDSEGRFEFKDVPCIGNDRRTQTKEGGGPYDVIALPDEYKRGDGDRRNPLAATWSHVEDGDNVILKSPEAASISGQVTDHEGKPLADAIVQVRYFMTLKQLSEGDLDQGEWPAHNDPGFISLKETDHGTGIRTSKDGRFTFFNLPADYGVIFEASHPEFVGQLLYAATVDSFSREQRRAQKQQLLTSPLKVKLDPGHHIKVRVIYRDTGELAIGAVAAVRNPKTLGTERRVHPDGTFELRRVPNGRFQVRVDPPQNADRKYAGGEKTVFLSPEKRQHLLTVRLLTATELETHRKVQEFLSRMEAAPRSPALFKTRPRKPRSYLLNESGDVNELRLRGRKLKPGDVRLIAELAYLEKLDLHDTDILNEDLAILGRLKNLRELDISWNRDVKSGVSHLAALKHLTSLNLRLSHVGNDDLAFLKDLPNLRHLNLSDTDITDEGLRTLSQLPNIETLRLSDNRFGDDGLEQLKALPKLRGVTLDDTRVTERGLKSLAAVPRFKWIATVDDTLAEFVRRLEAGEFKRAGEMRSAGLQEPTRGKVRLLKRVAHAPTPNDNERGIRRFRLEFHWTFENGQSDEMLYLDVRVNRGTVRITQAGIVQ